jgi:hypothetical protein
VRVETAEGEVIELGTTETNPTISIRDYSRRETDDFGVTTVVERGFARTMSVRLAVPFDQVDALQRRLADLRATSASWIADERFGSLAFEGFYKEFELDLAVPPLSFCTLSVEGLVEAAAFTETGEDPAPDGRPSTLRLLQPIAVTDAVLTASSVPETDYAAWAAGTTYAAGARVIAGHRTYESIASGNVGHSPAATPDRWLDVGPTNRWAMFDQALGTATTAAEAAITLQPGSAVNGLALLDVDAGTVRVQTPGYDRTQPVTPGKAVTFLDLSVAAGASITVTVGRGVAAFPSVWDDAEVWNDAEPWFDTITAGGGNGDVSIGTLLLGRVVDLGVTEASPTAGIRDFSRKEVDDFGEVTVVERAWAKRMGAKALIRTEALDLVAGRVAAVRARPSLWIGDDEVDSLIVYGFFTSFSVEVGETVSKLSLAIEGLSKAAPKGDGQLGKITWPDVLDPDGTKPADNATNSADPDSPFGPDITVGETLEQFGTLEQLVADVQDALADTENGALGAKTAAEAAAAIAATARDQSQAARDAANLAKQAALENAQASAQSATSASGFATTAEGHATIASQKADEAGQEATIAKAQVIIATTKASEASVSAQSAATASNSASGSAASAAQSAQVAANAAGSVGDASGFAAAASQSAQSAAASSTLAGQRASAASTSADSAATRAGEATASASRAAVSETNASGSAQAAASSATLAATARGQAETAATASQSAVAAANSRAAEAATSASLAAAYSGTSSNLVQNTQFETTANWTFVAGGGNMAGGIDVAGTFWAPPGEKALSIIQTDAGSAGANYVQDAVSIVPGQTYEASAWLGELRCDVSLFLDFLDSGGGLAGRHNAGGPAGQLVDGNLSSYTRVHVRQTAPSNATKARIVLVKSGTLSGPDSYAWMVRPQIRQVQPLVPAPAAYIPNIGGFDATSINASITAEATARASGDAALASDLQTTKSTVNGLSATVTTQTATLATLGGKLGAYWKTMAVAGNNRAQLAVFADANGGAGVDIIGDVSIAGSLVVDGTITSGKHAPSSVQQTMFLTLPSDVAVPYS